MIKYIINIMLLLAIISTSVCYAGGDTFDIKINNIETISAHKHIIHFKKLQQNNNYIDSLDNCENIKLTINYKYKESKIRQVLLFFQLLFWHNEFNNGVKELNKHINHLKANHAQNPNSIYTTDDIEAFKHDTKNSCHIYSKYLEYDYHAGKNQLRFFVR